MASRVDRRSEGHPRSTKFILTTRWIRTRRLSIKNSLFHLRRQLRRSAGARGGGRLASPGRSRPRASQGSSRRGRCQGARPRRRLPSSRTLPYAQVVTRVACAQLEIVVEAPMWHCPVPFYTSALEGRCGVSVETRRSLLARLFGKRLREGTSDGESVRRVHCTALIDSLKLIDKYIVLDKHGRQRRGACIQHGRNWDSCESWTLTTLHPQTMNPGPSTKH